MGHLFLVFASVVVLIWIAPSPAQFHTALWVVAGVLVVLVVIGVFIVYTDEPTTIPPRMRIPRARK